MSTEASGTEILKTPESIGLTGNVKKYKKAPQDLITELTEQLKSKREETHGSKIEKTAKHLMGVISGESEDRPVTLGDRSIASVSDGLNLLEKLMPVLSKAQSKGALINDETSSLLIAREAFGGGNETLQLSFSEDSIGISYAHRNHEGNLVNIGGVINSDGLDLMIGGQTGRENINGAQSNDNGLSEIIGGFTYGEMSVVELQKQVR